MGKKLTIQLSAKTLVITAVVLGLAALAGGLTYDKFRPLASGPIPHDIASNLQFTPIIVNAEAQTYKQTSFEYATIEGATKVLSFIITLPSGTTVTASQYPQPSQFNEVQDYKAKFLENKSEDTAITDSGTIYLSHPEKQKDKQIGLMLEKGLIVFFNPDKNLTKDEWRDLGNNLTTQRSN